jgi:hypothetical protein
MGSFQGFPGLSIDTEEVVLNDRFHFTIQMDRRDRREWESQFGMVRS